MTTLDKMSRSDLASYQVKDRAFQFRDPLKQLEFLEKVQAMKNRAAGGIAVNQAEVI